jgi:hypothetical protein
MATESPSESTSPAHRTSKHAAGEGHPHDDRLHGREAALRRVGSFLDNPEPGELRAVFSHRGPDPRLHGWVCDLFGSLWFCMMPPPPADPLQTSVTIASTDAPDSRP